MNDESGGSRRRRGGSPKRGRNKSPGVQSKNENQRIDDFVTVCSSSVQALGGKLPLRPPSRTGCDHGRCRSLSPPGRSVSNGGARQSQFSLEAMERERKRLSLMLGDEQFPADDVSAFLGDFSITDFPGVDIKGAATATSANQKKKKKKKQKKKAESRVHHKRNDVSIAAVEALEKSAIARHKGELAKKLHAKKHQMLQQPGSQTTSSTTSEASVDTAGSMLRSPGSPWDTQNEPQLSPRRPSTMAKLRSLLTPPTAKKSSNKVLFHQMKDGSGSLELPVIETDNVSTVSSKCSSKAEIGVAQGSGGSDKKLKKKKKTNSRKRKPRKDKEAVPAIPATTATKPHSHTTTATNAQEAILTTTTTSPGGRSSVQEEMEESHTSFSLSLSDLEKSHSSLTSAEISITTATAHSAASSISTLNSHKKASKSTHHDSSGSISTSQSSTNYDDMMDGSACELEVGLDQQIHQPCRSYPTDTSILLDSLPLDTVHETNEDAFSEATSRHTINYSSDHDSRRQSFRSFGSAHSNPHLMEQHSSSAADIEGEKQEHSDNNAVRRGRRSIVGLDSNSTEDTEDDDIISDEDDNGSIKSCGSQTFNKSDKCLEEKSQSQHRPTAEGGVSEIEHSPFSMSRERWGSKSTQQRGGKDHCTHGSSTGNRQRNHYHNADRSTSHHNASARSSCDDHPTSVCFCRDGDDSSLEGSHDHLVQLEPHGYAYRGHPYACYGEPDLHHYSHQDPYQDYHYQRHTNSHAGFVNAPTRRVDRYNPFYDRAFTVEGPFGMIGGRSPPATRDGDGWNRGPNSRPEKGRELPKRRHSIGSGHSRDSIMNEICATKHQEYRQTRTCKQCGHTMTRCDCNEPGDNRKHIIDTSHHSHKYARCRNPPPMLATAPRDLESRLTSSGASSSLFETFGIRYLDEGRRLPRHRLDDESHSWNRPLPAQPLYHRPDGFDINEYVESTTEPNGGRVSHRGRQMYSMATDHDNSNRQCGVRGVVDKRWTDDDGSLRYPPRRFSFGGSFSGRTTLFSWDDASLHSFAI